MATPYDGMTNEELIATLLDRDDEIALLKADADTPVILQTKIDDLDSKIIEMSRKKQDLPGRSGLDEFERTVLTEGYTDDIEVKKADKTKLELLKQESIAAIP